MSSFVIEGGYRLSGEIVPQGAKNEALEVICATLLTPEKVTIHNVPDILDVNNLIQLLRDMRVKVEHPSADTYTFQADDVDMEYLSTEEFLRKSGSLRGSVMIVGPLVARFGRALIRNRVATRSGDAGWIRTSWESRSWALALATTPGGKYTR